MLALRVTHCGARLAGLVGHPGVSRETYMPGRITPDQPRTRLVTPSPPEEDSPLIPGCDNRYVRQRIKLEFHQ